MGCMLAVAGLLAHTYACGGHCSPLGPLLALILAGPLGLLLVAYRRGAARADACSSSRTRAAMLV